MASTPSGRALLFSDAAPTTTALLLTTGITAGTIRLDCGPGVDKAIGFTTAVGCGLN